MRLLFRLWKLIDPWIVAIASCSINFFLDGVVRMNGMFFVSVQNVFGVNRQRASWPFALCVAVRNLSGPLVGIIAERFGAGSVTLVGGLVSSIGLGLCYFSYNFTYLTISWGILFGFGYGMGNILLSVIIANTFKEKVAMACGLSISGACLGSLVLPSVLQFLLSVYGLKGTFLVLSSLILHCVPLSMLIILYESPDAREYFSFFQKKRPRSQLENVQASTASSNKKIFEISDPITLTSKLSNAETDSGKGSVSWKDALEQDYSFLSGVSSEVSRSIHSADFSKEQTVPNREDISDRHSHTERKPGEIVLNIYDLHTEMAGNSMLASNCCTQELSIRKSYSDNHLHKELLENDMTIQTKIIDKCEFLKHDLPPGDFNNDPGPSIDVENKVSIVQNTTDPRLKKQEDEIIYHDNEENEVEHNIDHDGIFFTATKNSSTTSEMENESIDTNTTQSNTHQSALLSDSKTKRELITDDKTNSLINASIETSIASNEVQTESVNELVPSKSNHLVANPFSIKTTPKESCKISSDQSKNMKTDLSKRNTFPEIKVSVIEYIVYEPHDLTPKHVSKGYRRHANSVSYSLDSPNFFLEPPNQKKIKRSSMFKLSPNTRMNEENCCQPKPVSEKRDSLSVLKSLNVFKNPVFLGVTFAMTIYEFIFVTMTTIMIDYSRDIGGAQTTGEWIIMVFSAGNILGRMCLGWITDKKHLEENVFTAICFIGISVMIMAMSFAGSLTFFGVTICGFGIFESGAIMMFPILMKRYIEDKELTMAVSSSNFGPGMIVLAIPTAIGYFRDWSGSYDGLLYVVIGMSVVSAALCLALPWISRNQLRKTQQNS